MKFGLSLEGTEEKFEAALRERARPGKLFSYLEIGVLKCGTLEAVCSILDSTGLDWRAVGIDPNPETSEHFNRMMDGRSWPVRLIEATREEAFREYADIIGSHLTFTFIDGCHSEPCATGDFLAVEHLIVPGGLVVFHDFWEGPAGIGKHCGLPIGVIPAVKNLGLFDNQRPGWKRLPDWETDMSTQNRPCGVFEKLSFLV